MSTIYFSLPGNEELTNTLAKKEQAEIGKAELRYFPDKETYVRVLSDVKQKHVVLVCTLHQPDDKLLPLYFLSQTVKTLGARSVNLIAPYLAYMRQDKVFNEGEGVTSTYFAKLLSGFADSMITIDPHLHRRSSLAEIYSIPTKVAHAADHISAWIINNIDKPVLIGPDAESEQWVADVANKAGAHFTVLKKIRHGDNDVEVSVPQVDEYKTYTPVLVDDIISTGRTMIETINHLKKAGMKAPVCIGVHAVFAGNAYYDIQQAGAASIITCNTIPHLSNQIDISDLLKIEFL
jgi:ribose-phosphate pyrophosphokinase